MSSVPVWSVFAYMNGDTQGRRDIRRSVPQYAVPDMIAWCQARGYDNINLARTDETVVYAARACVHFWHEPADIAA